MSQHVQYTKWSRHAVCLVVAAVTSLLAAGSAQAQWAAKPPPTLPRPILDQAISGSVVLGLVFESNGQVRDVRIVRSSGTESLDEIARKGALRWRLDPAAMQPSDLTTGRQHMIKFYQDARVARRVEPITAFWRER